MKTVEFIQKVNNQEIDIITHTRNIINTVKKINEEYSHFNQISDELALEQAQNLKFGKTKGKLSGVAVSVKDCICVQGVESRSGSRILSGYKPPYNATVVQKVIDEGGIIIGKTSQDEFGFGSFSVNVGLDLEIPLNAYDKERTAGGSSGGSGGFTQLADLPHISIGESTGGSIECPASFNGVVGFCPTYGLVSRYGLMDYANSLDKIGPMAKTMEDACIMLNVIAGHDPLDSTSLNHSKEDYTKYLDKPIEGMKIGIIKEIMEEGVDETVLAKMREAIGVLESKGAKFFEVSLPITAKYGIPCYYLIAVSEASTNLAKYCGMRYGAEEPLEGGFNEYFTKVRSKHFGQEAKRRIILGTFARMAGYRDAYYIKATKVRTKIIEEYKNAFKHVDVLLSPTMPFIAPKFDEIKELTPMQNYMADIMTVGPNLAGIPHASIPIGFKDGMPIGMMVMADHLKEGNVIKIGSAVEKEKE